MSDTSNATRRADARAKGLRFAAKVATVGGIAVAALGLVEARAAASATHASATPASTASTTSSAGDDTKPLPMEGWMKTGGGNCGCGPCWGPPAPPAKSGLS